MNNNYLRTYTGRAFYPEEPELLEVNIMDVAHALSNVCRYNGHLARFYSVAQHSYYVSLLVENIAPELSLQALLHDASEAYLPDMPTPIKHMLPDFQKLEGRLLKHIFKSFGLSYPVNPIVKEIDVRIRWDEIRAMQSWRPEEGQLYIGTGIHIARWSNEDARDIFLHRYNELTSSSPPSVQEFLNTSLTVLDTFSTLRPIT